MAEDWCGREPPRLRHIGDVAWGWHIAPGERRVRLWPSAWAWYAAPNWIEVQIAGDDLETELHDEVLEWVEQQSPEPVALDVLDSDRSHLAALERRGYRQIEHEYPLVHLARPLAETSRRPPFRVATACGMSKPRTWAPRRRP